MKVPRRTKRLPLCWQLPYSRRCLRRSEQYVRNVSFFDSLLSGLLFAVCCSTRHIFYELEASPTATSFANYQRLRRHVDLKVRRLIHDIIETKSKMTFTGTYSSLIQTSNTTSPFYLIRKIETRILYQLSYSLTQFARPGLPSLRTILTNNNNQNRHTATGLNHQGVIRTRAPRKGKIVRMEMINSRN